MDYRFKTGDSLGKLANRFKVSIFSIIISNPDIRSIKTIKSGQYLKIPEPLPEFIKPANYTYEQMLNDILALKNHYSFVNIALTGKSVQGKVIPAIRLGNGPNIILCNGSHHAREWITTPLLTKFSEAYCSCLVSGNLLYNYNISNIYSRCTIWIVPMVNPDGVNLVIKGLSKDNPFYSELLNMTNNSTAFTSWKANIKGVDLNRNYYAGWQMYKSLEPKLGILGPSAEGYSGPHPESEFETQAMTSFTRLVNPLIVLAFHAQGEEIYWDYNGMAQAESEAIAKTFSEVSGYTLKKPDEPTALHAGYKDWFIKEFNRPGFTIEVGRESTPVPLTQFEEIVEKNFKIILKAASTPNSTAPLVTLRRR